MIEHVSDTFWHVAKWQTVYGEEVNTSHKLLTTPYSIRSTVDCSITNKEYCMWKVKVTYSKFLKVLVRKI